MISSADHDPFSHGVHRTLRRLRRVARLCMALGMLLLAALAVVALVSSIIPRIIGVRSYVIVSGSMEPAYPVGSLVYAEPVEGADLHVGDVAVFRRDQDIIVHRVKSNNGLELATKGDANAAVDVRPVSYANVLGRVVFQLPGIGSVLTVFSSTSGRLLLGLIVVMGAALCVVGSVLDGLVS